jgi:hypothetical protein
MPPVISPQSLNTFTRDLGPWTPDIDIRKNEKPAILAGTNFQDDIDGPASAWSSNFINWNFWELPSRAKICELKISNDILYGAQDGVWRINKISGVMELLLAVDVTNTFWPWTIAYVGGVYYIAQYDIGLWRYNPTENSLIHVTTPTGDTVRYVAESAGRLLYLSDAYVVISAQDDGTNLTPSLTTAAQAQPISLIGGTAFRIEVLADGFLVYTSNGIMKATYTQAAYVFRWDVLQSRVRLFSPNAAVYVPKVGAIALDNSGFSLTKEYNYTDGGNSQPWEVAMGDYLRTNLIQYLDKTKYGNISLYWSDAEQKLFVSFSTNALEGVMIYGFVWSAVTKRWGSFDHQNTGIFETYAAVNNQYTCGYMGTDGYMRAFSNTNLSQGLPDQTTSLIDYLYRIEDEAPILATVPSGTDVVELATTEILGSDNNPNAYSNFQTSSGLYEINSEVYSDTVNNSMNDPDMVIEDDLIIAGTYINMDISGVVELFAIIYQLPSIGLNSSLTIGPYRFSDQTAPDETSAVSGIVLGLTNTSSFIVREDWNVLSGNEDWNDGNGAEDWGSGNSIPNNFTLTLRNSDDAINAPIQGDENLEVFNDLGSALSYTPMGYSSIYHTLTLSAQEVGESFAVKTVDFTGLLTGRLDSR